MARSAERRTLLIVSLALFMVALDNLVVTVALPSIRRAFGSSVQSLEWTVNAYTLAYAALLLTGAALGDRFGRRRTFLAGMTLFTVASAGAALAPSTGMLIAARALQGAGAAMAPPLRTAPCTSRNVKVTVEADCVLSNPWNCTLNPPEVRCAWPDSTCTRWNARSARMGAPGNCGKFR